MGYEPVTRCSRCGDSFDVYRAPGYRICDACEEIFERNESWSPFMWGLVTAAILIVALSVLGWSHP